MDEKWIFLLIMNRDNSDKLCWHLVEIEKLSPPPRPPPLKSSISMERLQRNGNLRKRNNVCSKGQRDADSSISENGAALNYSFLALKCSPPSIHPRGSIYSPSIGNEGSSQSVFKHMEGQESSYLGLIEENSIFFVFMHISRCMWATVEKLGCTHEY